MAPEPLHNADTVATRKQVWRCGGGVKHDLILAPLGTERPEVCPICKAWGSLEAMGEIEVPKR